MSASCRRIGHSRFSRIPRVIHQTWKSRDVPGQWRDYHDSWRKHHPDWEVRIWTDDDNRNLIATHYPWFLETYDGFSRNIHRVDAAKYFILYTHGGVYADMDCECLAPIDDLVRDGGAVFGRTADGVIECAFMASAPQHPVWHEVFAAIQHPSPIARLIRSLPSFLADRGFDAASVLFLTGPQMMRRVVKRYCRRNRAEGEGVTILPSRYLSDRSWWDRHNDQGPATGFIVHHYSNSWIESAEGRYVHRFTRSLLISVIAASFGLITLATTLVVVWNTS